MARWDHADLLSLDAKAVLYPEYSDLCSILKYNPKYLETLPGKKRMRFLDDINIYNETE